MYVTTQELKSMTFNLNNKNIKQEIGTVKTNIFQEKNADFLGSEEPIFNPC